MAIDSGKWKRTLLEVKALYFERALWLTHRPLLPIGMSNAIQFAKIQHAGITSIKAHGLVWTWRKQN